MRWASRVLMMIDIPVIKDLALTASIGVAVLILTNLILLPVLLSYVGVSPRAAARSLQGDEMAPPRLQPACGTGSSASPNGAGPPGGAGRGAADWRSASSPATI